MTWNYRVIRHSPRTPYDDETLAIHEVYYDDKGNPTSCTVDPTGIVGDDLRSLRLSIAGVMRALQMPILEMKMFDDMAAPKRSTDG